MHVRKIMNSGVAMLAVCCLAVWVASGQQPEKAKDAGGKPEEKSAKVELPKCPVSGESVNLFVSTDTADGPVYFCCADCIAKFKANPKDYAEKVAAQRAAVAKLPRAQVTCPISGEPIDKKSFIEDHGQKVYFCCDDCKGKYEASAAAKAKLASCCTYQAKCPVEGGAIDPAVFIELPNKQHVYFCCKGCDKKFLEHPEEYAPKLAAQGYQLDVAAVKKLAAEKTGKAGEKDEKKHHP